MVELDISNPKRNSKANTGWHGFFPYYAGFPEAFATGLLSSRRLASTAKIFDPWNGSGTTTYAASRLGFVAIGHDINPAMVVIARARLLAASEADSLEPLATKILKCALLRSKVIEIGSDDPLLFWYTRKSATFLRAVEIEVRTHLVGELALPPDGKLDRISGIAATFYVALFFVCRRLLRRFQASNPTWLKTPRKGQAKIGIDEGKVSAEFLETVRGLAAALCLHPPAEDLGTAEVRLADTTSMTLKPGSIDFVLTSPPYCTRIDYTAATRVELAVLAPILQDSVGDLRRTMTGSVRVPQHHITPLERWGPSCLRFLEAMLEHRSKASTGYYYKTHLDYFDKMSRSIANVSKALQSGGDAVFVVQDSHYKELHNDLPTTLTEMAESSGLRLKRRVDFESRLSMVRINSRARQYRESAKKIEAVLCFEKD